MIGYALALFAALAAPAPKAGAMEVKAFVLAFISDKPASALPFASPKLEVKLGGYVGLRPDIKENLASVRAAVSKCEPIGIRDLDAVDQGDHWYQVDFNCPGQETDDSRRLSMSVIVDDSGIFVVNLMIGAGPPVSVN